MAIPSAATGSSPSRMLTAASIQVAASSDTFLTVAPRTNTAIRPGTAVTYAINALVTT